jgi:hypothetical protein
VEGRAIAYARGRGFRYVTCGHTHFPLVSKREGVLYLNSGSWIDYPPCPFVSVRGTEVRLEGWPMAQTVTEPEVANEPAPGFQHAMPPSLPAMG